MTAHEITIERGMFGGFRLVCSHDPDGYIWFFGRSEVPLQAIMRVAYDHIKAAGGFDSPVDVPARGYVHGLDPAEEDPRRGVLE